MPGTGARVQIGTGHTVEYDVQSEQPIRFIHVAGTLTFSRDRDTQLNVGLIKIESGENAVEDGFDCADHLAEPVPGAVRPTLSVGTPAAPIAAGKTALIRLVLLPGMDKQSCPAIVCCGGQMEFHGAPLSRTWVKLGAPAKVGDAIVDLAEPVTGWRPGDRIFVTATTRQNKIKKTFRPSLRENPQTEVRIVRSIDGKRITLDSPLSFDHIAEEGFRAEVANLSRNVIVESADPASARGHTMYHRHSAGSIGYAEFRHLGKEGVLGRYSLHFHLVGDTMRGSSVIGASIWDSGNRWLTIHGTNYLVVRDCVGFQSVGHGFFLEDGTEQFNVLDRNLAVQALNGQPLPKQVLPFDKNDGSGFWWANSCNTLTRNVAAECDEYGYFFQATKTADFDPVLPVRQPDGAIRRVDIRTLPFIRCEDNEAHCQRRHSFNLGGGVPFGAPNVDGIGPDSQHPFVIRNLKLWDVHWGIHPVSPSLWLDHLEIHQAEYGIWRPVYNEHYYRQVNMTLVPEKNQFAFATGQPHGEADFPKLRDDLPPTTVITHTLRQGNHKLLVRGTTADNGEVDSVQVNGQSVRLTKTNFGQWEVELSNVPQGAFQVTAWAADSAGNLELRPHTMLAR